MQHIFYGQEGYEPTFYGKDINWKYWPIKDNEVRWMLHRHKWFIPMGYAYRASKDEKYAKEWAFQYMDWIKKIHFWRFPKKNMRFWTTVHSRTKPRTIVLHGVR